MNYLKIAILIIFDQSLILTGLTLEKLCCLKIGRLRPIPGRIFGSLPWVHRFGFLHKPGHNKFHPPAKL